LLKKIPAPFIKRMAVIVGGMYGAIGRDYSISMDVYIFYSIWKKQA